MAARSELRHFHHPYPAVMEALVNALPSHRFRLLSSSQDHGKVVVASGWSRWSMGEVVTIHVGADDATSTSVVLDSALKAFGVASKAHPRAFARVFAALDSYLAYYYGRV